MSGSSNALACLIHVITSWNANDAKVGHRAPPNVISKIPRGRKISNRRPFVVGTPGGPGINEKTGLD